MACALSATLILNGCGGSSGPSVQGNATPVPGTDVNPAPDTGGTSTTTNTPPDANDTPTNGGNTPAPVRRFVGVAPATTDSPKYAISPAIQYQLGAVVTSPIDQVQKFDSNGNPVLDKNGQPVFVKLGVNVIPVQGWLRYPVAAASANAQSTRYPIVVFLHGQHRADEPSYQGYDYLATDLARQGYVVLSIDANWINGIGSGDPSSESRAQLILGTLDRMRQIDANGGPGVLSALRGKLDFDRIGIMGHSRGGQGVSYTIKYNLTRKGVSEQAFVRAIARNPENFANFPDLVAAVGDGKAANRAALDAAMTKYNIFYAAGGESTPPYNIRAGIMLAPTDFNLNVGVSNVPLATVVSACDGDVASMDGAHAFDINRFGTQYDSAPRYQVVVQGANHNYFNTTWVLDDVESMKSDLNPNYAKYCSFRSGGPRLSASDQRRSGVFLINSFMRYFVGSETQFADYWNGINQLPPEACPAGSTTCDERALLTIQKDSSQSRLIQRFMDSGSLASNALGGGLVLAGFDQISACSIPYAPTPWYTPACNPASPKEFTIQDHLTSNSYFGGGGYVSIADAVRLTWSSSNAKISTDLRGMSATAYDSLTFRVAIVRPMGQEVVVTMTDSKGQSASVNASDFSDALYLAPKPKGAGRPLDDDPEDAQFASTGAPTQLLNMVSIPLAAFTGVDKTSLAKVEFALPKASGMIAFTDLEFQNFGRGTR